MHHRALDRNKLQLQKAPASAFQQLKSTCIHPNSVIILDTFIFLFVNLSYSEDCIEQPDLKRRFLSLFKSPLRAPKLTWNLQVQLQDWDNYQCRYYKTICFSLLFFFSCKNILMQLEQFAFPFIIPTLYLFPST